MNIRLRPNPALAGFGNANPAPAGFEKPESGTALDSSDICVQRQLTVKNNAEVASCIDDRYTS